jgi:hypothetical protein
MLNLNIPSFKCLVRVSHLTKDKKDIKVDQLLESVESYSDRWVSEDTDSFYYDIKE